MVTDGAFPKFETRTAGPKEISTQPTWSHGLTLEQQDGLLDEGIRRGVTHAQVCTPSNASDLGDLEEVEGTLWGIILHLRTLGAEIGLDIVQRIC